MYINEIRENILKRKNVIRFSFCYKSNIKYMYIHVYTRKKVVINTVELNIFVCYN